MGTFNIGCSEGLTNRAFFFTIEAARNLASGRDRETRAIKLLEMAICEIKAVAKAYPYTR